MKPLFPRSIARRLGLSLLLIATPVWGQSVYDVTSTLDDGSVGTLRWAITQADANTGSTINFANNLGTVTLGSALPTITTGVTINGGTGNTISGDNAYRIFFVDTASATDAVSINNLNLVNGYAKGGDGGTAAGGGLGAGGAIFVNSGALTISGVDLESNTAQGGAGGHAWQAAPAGQGGSGPLGQNGGLGGGPGEAGQDGGYGGGGGSGAGQITAGQMHFPNGLGGIGGFGAGSGGSSLSNINGSSVFVSGGAFGGDGGTALIVEPGNLGAGGGGAGLGGSLFVRGTNGGSLTVLGSLNGSGTVIGGAGGASIPFTTGGENGQGAGGFLFVDGGTTNLADGTISGSIAGYDQAILVKNGTGLLTVSGGVDVRDGQFIVNGGMVQLGTGGTSGAVSGNVILNNSSVLALNFSDTTTYTGTISGNGFFLQMAQASPS